MIYPQFCCVTCQKIELGKTPSVSAQIPLVPPEPLCYFCPTEKRSVPPGGSSTHGL